MKRKNMFLKEILPYGAGVLAGIVLTSPILLLNPNIREKALEIFQKPDREEVTVVVAELPAPEKSLKPLDDTASYETDAVVPVKPEEVKPLLLASVEGVTEEGNVPIGGDALYDHHFKYKDSFRKMSKNDEILMDQILNSIITPDMNRVEQIKAVHDWMVCAISYDMTYTQHTASDVLNNRLAVCSGYAALFANFCDALGIPNVELSGLAYNGERYGNHAWNAVLIDGFWYEIDVTWDDGTILVNGGYTSNFPDGYNLSYDYFLLSEGAMGRDHFAGSLPSPMAQSNLNLESYIRQFYEDTPDPGNQSEEVDNEPVSEEVVVPEEDSENPEDKSFEEPDSEEDSEEQTTEETASEEESEEPDSENTSEEVVPEPKDPSKGIPVEPNDTCGPGPQTDENGNIIGETDCDWMNGTDTSVPPLVSEAETGEPISPEPNGPWAGSVD